MSLFQRGIVFSLSIAAGALVLPQASPRDFAEVGRDVYAATRREPLGLAQNGNSLIVVGSNGVLVVDAQFTREATLETLAAIRKVTRKPIQWVVNTHWHDDHFAGNQVYRDSFPQVRFVTHANTRRDLETVARANRRGELAGGPAAMNRYERLLAARLGVDSTPVSSSEGEVIRNALRIYRQYLAEAPQFVETLDGPIVQERHTIDLGGRRVELRWFGRAATRGDLVVHVPDVRVVAAGDIIVDPVPFAFSAHPSEWIAALDSIESLRPAVIVPGHGQVQRDLSGLRRHRSMMVAVRDQVHAGVARATSFDSIAATIDADQWRREIAGDDKWTNWMWRQYFLQPFATRAYLEARRSRAPLEKGVYALTGANVVPMTSDTVIRNVTILVRDGRIAAIGPAASVPVPRGARVVNVAGKYVMPGLADSHTHLFAGAHGVPVSAAPAELGVMLANGVTAARFMIGSPALLAIQRDVAQGRVPGPQLWVASPHVASDAADGALRLATTEEARAAVSRFASEGYDFIKLTGVRDTGVYVALIDEARTRGIRVVGHVDPAVGIGRALKTSQQLSHLDSFLEAVLADSSPIKTSLTQYGVFQVRNWPSMDFVDRRKVDSVAGAVARSGAWIEPTLHLFNAAFAERESLDTIRSRPDFALWPTAPREGYLRAYAQYWSAASDGVRTVSRRQRYIDTRNRLVKVIADSGGRLLAGSDTPEWFHSYGYGLHRELAAFVAAGLTPFRALRTATRDAAEYFRMSEEWGTIEPGKRADLLLLDANPLNDVKNTQRIHAVAIGGRYFGRPDLDRLLAEARRTLTGGR